MNEVIQRLTEPRCPHGRGFTKARSKACTCTLKYMSQMWSYRHLVRGRQGCQCSISFKKDNICFVHPIFRFWFLDTFGNEVTKVRKLRNLCLHFARQDGQDGKKQKENHVTKVTKIKKPKRLKYVMNETIMQMIS